MWIKQRVNVHISSGTTATLAGSNASLAAVTIERVRSKNQSGARKRRHILPGGSLLGTQPVLEGYTILSVFFFMCVFWSIVITCLSSLSDQPPLCLGGVQYNKDKTSKNNNVLYYKFIPALIQLQDRCENVCYKLRLTDNEKSTVKYHNFSSNII